MSLNGAEVRKILEDIVGQIVLDWDKKLERLAERNADRADEIRGLQGRVDRLERIIERIGKAALQEKP